jgi:hypothetical protein
MMPELHVGLVISTFTYINPTTCVLYLIIFVYHFTPVCYSYFLLTFLLIIYLLHESIGRQKTYYHELIVYSDSSRVFTIVRLS